MRLLPILLIHGFNSAPDIWYDSGFVAALTGRGLNPGLIQPFFYGEAPDGTYDNRGDVAELASRLAAAISALVTASQAAGGPDQVTLIGHSLGGLIARYYLSCGETDKFGTRYAGDVARLITLGTPHLGVPSAEAADLLPRDSWLWNLVSLIESLPFLSARPASELEELKAQLLSEQQMAMEEAFAPPPPLGPEGDMIAQVTLEESEALRQIQPDNPLFPRINAPGAMPAEVEYHLIFGNVALLVEMIFWGIHVLRSEISLGDGAVPVDSASRLPNASFSSFEVPFKKQLRLEIGRKPAEGVAAGIGDLLPYALHTRLYANAEVQQNILTHLGVTS